jgi:hypothetical protein
LIVCDEVLDKLVNFVLPYYPQYDNNKVRQILLKHIEYNTIDYATEQGKVVAFVRWNVDKNTANILDLIISPEWRNKKIIPVFLSRAVNMFPYLENIAFERGRRDLKPRRIYKIEKFCKSLKRR